jgi:hypothetical protein
MGALVQDGIGPLLEMSGARIRGRSRADCPECKRPRAVSFNETAFCCHGIDCGFHGGIGTLRLRLGIEREWLPRPEYIRQCRERERVHDAAERLYVAAHARQLELRETLREFGRMEQAAHEQGPDDPKAWDTLASVYTERPAIEQELDAVESDDPAAVFAILREKGEKR